MPLNPVPIGFEALVTPEGELVYSPKANVENNVKNLGYRLPTSEDFSKATLKKEYGEGFGNELKAGVEGALSGATFGGSRHLANILGITTPEAQAARKEFNPVASGVGEAVGIGGSLLLAPELSLPGALAEGAGRVGLQAGRLLGEGAAAKIAGQAVASGLEGLAYGASQPISESALGDPTLTASKAFSQIGLGGLIGGATGGAFSALGLGTKKLFSKAVSPEAEAIVSRGTSTLEGEGTTIAKGPLKMEGTIDFGVPDEKILKQAESLNPKNPLKQNDLNFIKQESPEIFKKIGTPEVPTLDPMAQDQVYMGDVVKQGMKNLQVERQRLNQAADDALASTVMPNGEALSMTKKSYVKMFQNVIKEIKDSPEFGLPIGKRAVKSLDAWAKAGKDMQDEIPAPILRDILQNIRDEGRIYVKGGGLKEDFVSKSLNKVQSTLDQYLKDNSPAYKAIQEEFAPFTRNSMELEDHLGWNFQRNDSDLVSDWVRNRVAKPFQSDLPGTKADAELMRWFSKYAGTDLEKASKANFIYSKLNPEAVNNATWGARVAQGFDLLKNPTEIPGKVLSGTAKIALTGELPDFITQMKAKGVQDMLLGKSSNPNAVNSILGKLGDMTSKGSAFLEGPMSKFAVPAGVKLHEFIQDSDSVDHADRKLEVLQALEKAQKKADGKISSAVNSIFSDKSHKFDMSNDFFSQSPDELADQVDKLREHTNELVNNPETLLSHLDAANQGIQGAPDVVSAINMTAVRALQFLSQQMQMNMPQGEKLPLDPKTVPTKSQLYSLAKTMRFINQPWEVLHEISSGRVSKEGKQVLENVHPELYNDLKAQVLSKISEMQAKGKIIPMSKRLGLSYFLDQPLDSTMTPQAIMSNQMAFLMPQQSTQNAPTPKPSGAKNLDVSQRLLTPLQKVASRA